MAEADKSLIRNIMRMLWKVMPGDRSGENSRVVRMFGRVLRFKDLINGRLFKKWIIKDSWPLTSGSYIVGNPSASIAACTLASPELMEPLSRMKGVAISGRLVTVNLGIEKIITNTISNPNIRYLVVCGKESPVFHPAQGLRCLFQHGVDEEKRIKQAQGHYPVLKNLDIAEIETFLKQVELIDHTDEQNSKKLSQQIAELDRQSKPPFKHAGINPMDSYSPDLESHFQQIRPGGKRGTPTYDPKGFFIISVDHEAGEIVLQHYLPDNTPAHEMRGRRAEAMMRGLVREGLISQLSHAGYLGVELGKAETALRLGCDYEQDHPI